MTNRLISWFRKYRFELVDPPSLRDYHDTVHFLQACSFRKVECRTWLINKKLNCIILWLGVICTIAGTVSLTITKNFGYANLNCNRRHIECIEGIKWISKVYAIGISCIGCSVLFLVVSSFVFVHAYFIYYDNMFENQVPMAVIDGIKMYEEQVPLTADYLSYRKRAMPGPGGLMGLQTGSDDPEAIIYTPPIRAQRQLVPQTTTGPVRAP